MKNLFFLFVTFCMAATNSLAAKPVLPYNKESCSNIRHISEGYQTHLLSSTPLELGNFRFGKGWLDSQCFLRIQDKSTDEFFRCTVPKILDNSDSTATAHVADGDHLECKSESDNKKYISKPASTRAELSGWKRDLAYKGTFVGCYNPYLSNSMPQSLRRIVEKIGLDGAKKLCECQSSYVVNNITNEQADNVFNKVAPVPPAITQGAAVECGRKFGLY